MVSEYMVLYIKWFVTILTAAVTLFNYPEVDPNLRPINVPTSRLLKEYDFIIVGSGAGGSPLANRLTEIKNWTVLLLEAGGDETVALDTPPLTFFNRLTNANWNYSTVPQKYACKENRGVCNLPRGRVIGGSTALYDLVWVRANRLDYDGWAAQGNPGWSYRDVLPYLIRLENITDPSVIDSPYHGRGGPMTVGISRYLTQLVPHYLEAYKELGLKEIDFDGESQIGYMVNRAASIDGMTCSVGRGYLRPIRNRTNLDVAENAFVTKINIDPDSKTATGVTFIRYGEEISIRARKEVIVSGGAVNSPQLLMLSGIGPAEHLTQLGIPVIQDLRVGDNTQSPLMIPVLFTQSAGNFNLNFENTFNFQNLISYALNGSGPLTTFNGLEAAGNFYNEEPPAVLGLPDTRSDFISFQPFNLDDQVIVIITQSFGFTSKGTIRLASTNPFEQPLIDPQFLTTEIDRNRMQKSMRFPFRLAGTNAIQRIGARFAQELQPLCHFNGNVTDNFVSCIVENYSFPPIELCCTCKMGPPGDTRAVVDPRLRVHGVKNLRVVDGSIIPTYIHSMPEATTVMISERASDIIREDYGQPVGKLPPIPPLV
ncbi:hypothetical protein GE061_003520 [Apolygus lucorum]|uniref:Glucose-methanol-choline oxidoreductase N-terminal domain-containing protein n=1 Tax=Apolygus lucorum TaxID=248454 RepID=A0A6A4JCI5_APOLU|nr:hypothetical protein GE061_003520 [Apolygus lucorum]